MSTPVLTTEKRRLHKANDWIDVKSMRAPAVLFDDFWREGELALLFGAAGVGKSLLAVQIADALARGRGVEGFEMSATQRRQVLYVDLVLSDEQWAMRYSREGRGGARRAYNFSAGLYRDRPAEGEPLVDWLRGLIAAEKISVVIIDDLSVISQSDNGTSETLELMRELRKMTSELGVSVLVLADSHPLVYRHQIAERDLRRNRVLCAYAHSVFALNSPSGSDRRHLFQTRAQAGEPIWTHRLPVRLTLTARSDGFVGFEREEMPPEQRDMVLLIKQMRDQGHKFRAIADTLEISKSTAARLFAKWTPLLSEPPAVAGGMLPEPEIDPTQREDYFPGCKEYDEELTDTQDAIEEIEEGGKDRYEYELKLAARQRQIIIDARSDALKAYKKTGVAPRLRDHPEYKEFSDCLEAGGDPLAEAVAVAGTETEAVAVGSGSSKDGTGGSEIEPSEALITHPSPLTPSGLKVGTDADGEEIFIEKEDYRGKPVVWYRFDKNGTKVLYERGGGDILVTRIRPSDLQPPEICPPNGP